MPGRDRTGPGGQGAMTGGRRGVCGGAQNVQGRPFFGRALGRGFGSGGGRGFRNRYWATAQQGNTVDQADTVQSLRQQADILRNELGQIESRITELEQ